MFSIHSLKNKNLIELQNSSKSSKATICLNEGGRLRDLKLNDNILIKEDINFKYSNSYASSILFPFANRIESGKYSYENKHYELECNESNKNALHGFVYNKSFEVVKTIEEKNYSSIIISYKETSKTKGFPFTYDIQLNYTLYNNYLSLSVEVINTDTNSFPFTLGWHPYFYCKDLPKSSLIFDSEKKVEFDENLITKNIIDLKTEKEFKILNKQLDDCFVLNSNKTEFKTPEYQIEISSDQKENFLQLYTPKNYNLIAIEPMTGISNSFNNKIGLRVLEPNQSYSVTWTCRIK